MSRTGTTDSAEGKSVVDSEGNRIGLVAGVRDGTVWEHVDTDDYPLAESEIQTVTDDETKLEQT